MKNTRWGTLCALGAMISTLSCGGSNKSSTDRLPDKPATPIASSPESVAPMTVHQKQGAREAVILATSDGARKIPLAEKENSVTVDVMWFRNTSPPEGGSSPTFLSVAPQNDGAVRIGVFEQFQGGAGEMSRTSVWIAAFLASTVLGQDLTEYRFAAEVRGFVDGPSAGALITAGYLAALTNTPVDEKATMTGTVNPDGTVGPVGGIPQKFAASIKKGKKRLGYPIGSRFAADAGTGKLVDLRELASKSGVKAVEISDIYQAYEFLTGKALPRPTPLDASEMAVSAQVNEVIKGKYEAWREIFDIAYESATASGEGVPDAVKTLAKGARESADSAKARADRGDYVTAYSTLLDGVVLARTAAEVRAVTDYVRAGEPDQATKRLTTRLGKVNDAVEAMKKIGELHPTTIGGHLQMISSFQKGTAALGFAIWGSDKLRSAFMQIMMTRDATPEKLADPALAASIATAVMPGLINLHRAVVMADAASESIEIEATQSNNYSCSEPAARQLAASYSSAAVANLRYFESILLGEIARYTGMSEARARAFLGQLDPDYVAATVAMRMSLGEVETTQKLKEKWGEESLAWSLSSLGSSIMTYFKSSLLISRWYSLGVERDRLTGKTTKITHEKAFLNMLNNAERSAREHAHAAKVAIGETPIQAQLEFSRAKVLQGGDLDEKLRSLEAFWAASSYSQTAVVMARHVINPKKHGAAAK